VPRSRKAPPDIDVRTALLDAAGELLAAEGPAALTLRRLAARAGTTTQSIYTLFGGKEGIVRAMYREGYERLATRIRTVATEGEPLVELLDLGRVYRAAALASPNYYTVMFGNPVPEFEPNAEDIAISRGTLELLAGAVQRAIEAGKLRPEVDAHEIAQWLWAVAHGLVSLELAGALDLGCRADVSPTYDTYLRYSLHVFLSPSS
jgi:AcrR family transcriptional regulator